MFFFFSGGKTLDGEYGGRVDGREIEGARVAPDGDHRRPKDTNLEGEQYGRIWLLLTASSTFAIGRLFKTPPIARVVTRLSPVSVPAAPPVTRQILLSDPSPYPRSPSL